MILKNLDIKCMFDIFTHKLISKKEKNILLEWIYKNENKFIQNIMGNNRKYYKFSYDVEAPKLLFDIKDRIIKREKIKKWLLEPMYQDYIGIISNGGFIHEHIDENFNDLKHIRYNLFLTTPEKGGAPIYGGKKLKVVERNYLKCKSGNELHSCEIVEGNIPRIVVSYGFLI